MIQYKLFMVSEGASIPFAFRAVHNTCGVWPAEKKVHLIHPIPKSDFWWKEQLYIIPWTQRTYAWHMWKINETEPMSRNTSDVPRFKISVRYFHTMKVQYQAIDLWSAEKYCQGGSITSICPLVLTVPKHWAHASYWECHRKVQERGHWFYHP
jgi:hypothetical protein